MVSAFLCSILRSCCGKYRIISSGEIFELIVASLAMIAHSVVQSPLHGHYSQCYFVHIQLNNAYYNKAHLLNGKPYLAIFASNRLCNMLLAEYAKKISHLGHIDTGHRIFYIWDLRSRSFNLYFLNEKPLHGQISMLLC